MYMPSAIIVHGGAGAIPPELSEVYQAGCKEAALIGWRILQAGGAALDAVAAAVRSLEDNPHVLLVGRGAEQCAQEQGIPLCRVEDLLTGPRYERWLAGHSQRVKHNPGEAPLETETPEQHGTVGAVALDDLGRLAAATSTGGILNKYPGRVGDTPLVGCGFYADENAAISCTGHGEDFIRLLIAKRAADFVARGDSARRAAEAAIAVLGAKAEGVGGLIVVDRIGNIGFAWNSQTMAYAYIAEGMGEPITGV